jgi:hypothetical protein
MCAATGFAAANTDKHRWPKLTHRLADDAQWQSTRLLAENADLFTAAGEPKETAPLMYAFNPRTSNRGLPRLWKGRKIHENAVRVSGHRGGTSREPRHCCDRMPRQRERNGTTRHTTGSRS